MMVALAVLRSAPPRPGMRRSSAETPCAAAAGRAGQPVDALREQMIDAK